SVRMTRALSWNSWDRGLMRDSMTGMSVPVPGKSGPAACDGRPLRAAGCLQHFDGQGHGFAAADAQRSDAALAAGLAQGADQRGQQARSGSTDGVAQGRGAAVQVDLVIR